MNLTYIFRMVQCADSGRHRWILSCGSLATLILLVTLFQATLLRPYSVTVRVADGPRNAITLPHNGQSSNLEISEYEGCFHVGLLTNLKVRIIPDDFLTHFYVNGRNVDLSNIPAWKLGDWGAGFEISLGSYIRPGVNTFSIGIQNRSSPYGLRFGTSWKSAYCVGWMLGITVIICILMWTLQPWLGLQKGVLYLFWGAVLVRLFYFGYTGPYDRSYDVHGHLEHMNYLLEHRERPADTAGWECHQPTLYYVLAGSVFFIAEQLGLQHPASSIQLLSLLFDFCFLFCSARLFQLLIPARSIDCCALLFFWPSGVMNSVRINNDLPSYAFAAFALWFAVRWARSNRTCDILLSALGVGLGVLTKMTSLSVLAVVLLLWACKVVSQGLGASVVLWRQTMGAAVIIVLSIAGLYIDKLEQRWGLTGAEQIAPVVSSIDPSLRVGNALRNYWVFDSRDFLEEPYTHSRADMGGRQFFFNYFWKTSLFGEFYHYTPHAQVYLAHILKTFLIIFLGGAAVGFLIIGRVPVYIGGLFVGLLIFPLAALMFFRFNLPFSCNQDFRYAYIMLLALIPLAVGSGSFLEDVVWGGYRWVRVAVISLGVIFSSIFILMPYCTS